MTVDSHNGHLQIKDLNFYYGDTRSLHNICVDLSDRGVTAIIGPSGCGKSTLLRIFNRMYELYPEQRVEGRILFQGRNILDPKIDSVWLRTQFGMVFQKPTPFPMSIFENIAMAVRRHEKLSKADLRERVEWALDKAALLDEVKTTLKKSGAALSGGQQQRLCIARTIAIKPKVLLLDEPTSALDPVATRKVEELIQELEEEFKIIIVTHNMAQARRVGEDVLLMINGKVAEYGSVEKVFSNPEDDTVKAYIAAGD